MAHWIKPSGTGSVNLDPAVSIEVKTLDHRMNQSTDYAVFAYFNLAIDNDFARVALAVFRTEKEAMDYLENLYQKELKR